jgi:hypothetical protein
MKFRTIFFAAAMALLAALPGVCQNTPNNSDRYLASNYGQWQGKVSAGPTTTGAVTYTIAVNTITTKDGRTIVPFSIAAPLLIGTGNQETATPSAVSCPLVSGSSATCSVTVTVANAHGPGELIQSGTFGLAEAINDAFLSGGGIVNVNPLWALIGGTDAMLKAAVPYGTVAIEDTRKLVQYWNLQQTAGTFLAVPTTLTAVTALPSATPVGAYTTGTYHLCIAYVDVAGQVGACSADFSEAGLATGSFIFTPPAASAGAVGYVIYISLTGGTYSLSYQVPLSSSVCTLTLLETVTPACAVANTTYGQTGATATVTVLTVNTSPVDMQLGGVSGTLLTGNPNGRTTYGYVSSSHLAAAGIPTVNLAFTAGGIGSATPIAIGTVNIPGGILNMAGKQIRVCGKETNTDVNSTVQNLNIYYDAAGSDVAGSPVQIASLAATVGPGTAATYTGNFCWTGTTTVSGAGATAGSVLGGFSYLNYYLSATPAAIMVGGDTKTAAVASLNLAGTAGFENRISIVHTNTTGNATPTLQNLTLEIL